MVRYSPRQYPAGPAAHGVLRGAVAGLGAALALRAGAAARRQRGGGARPAAARAGLLARHLDTGAVSHMLHTYIHIYT